MGFLAFQFAIIFPTLSFFIVCFGYGQPDATLTKNKMSVIEYIENHSGQLVAWNNQLWEFAEPSFKETKSVKLLKDILRKEGFSIQENVGGMPTVFVATYGKGKPAVGLFGEYDADFNASNKIVPRQAPIIEGGYGHGGHHNLLAIGSLGAALAIKKLVQQGQLNCTIKYYGTTAEGSVGTKTFLARDGYFDDLDFSLYWHPAPATWASTRPWDALIDFDVIFCASRAKVIRESQNVPTTVDAVEFMVEEMKSLRRQMTPRIRMNYTVSHTSRDLNETPDTTRLSVRVQCARQEDALGLFRKSQEAVERIAKALGITGFVDIRRAMHQFLPNVTAMKVVQKNLELLGPTRYTDEEQNFTKEMQQSLKIPIDGIEDRILPFSDESDRSSLYGYASDIGDASWIAPEVYFVVRTLPGVPMHQWPGTAFSAHSIGHKGMLKASKILSMTIIDFVESKKLQQEIRDDFVRSKKGYTYKSLFPSSQR